MKAIIYECLGCNDTIMLSDNVNAWCTDCKMIMVRQTEAAMTKRDIEKLFEAINLNNASEREMLYQALQEVDTIKRIIYERLREIGE